jgi:hypothetical protein
MIIVWVDDYIVVMAYDNQYCLDTFTCLEYDADLLILINADEDCQWEVQTDECWTPYWDPQA